MAEGGHVCVGSDSVPDIFCDLCFEDGKHIKAEGFCTSCGDYLCSDCVTAHKKNRASKTHTIFEKGDMPKSKSKLLLNSDVEDESCVEKCDRHPNEFVKYYCRTHTCVGCHVCITIDHRLCEGVEHIPDVVEEQKELQKELDDLKSKSHTVLKLSKFNINNAEQISKDVNNATQQICEGIRDAVKAFEESIKKEVETLKTADLGRLKDVGDKCNQVLSEIELSVSNLQSLQNDKQFTQLFIMMKKVNGRIQTWGKSLDEANSGNTVSAYHVKSSSLVQQIIDKPTLLGKVTVTFDGKCKDAKRYDYVPNEPYLQPKPGPSPVNREAKPKLYKYKKPIPLPSHALKVKKVQEKLIAEYLHDITVKCKGESSDLGCQITSSAIVSDDKLVVADWIHKKLKLVNLDSKTVVSDLSLQSGPWAVASINPQKLVATLPDGKKIIFVRVTNTDTLVVEKKISLGGCCRNIVLCEDKLIVSFAEKPARLEILSLNGKCEKKLFQDKFGKELFVNLQGLALGPGGTVFVLDKLGNGDWCVKCVSLDGRVTVKYDNMLNKDDDVVCLDFLDQHNSVGVCTCGGYYNKGFVVLLEEDGIKPLLGELLSPESLMYCKRTSRLYIGYNNVNSISVYQLSRSPVTPMSGVYQLSRSPVTPMSANN